MLDLALCTLVASATPHAHIIRTPAGSTIVSDGKAHKVYNCASQPKYVITRPSGLRTFAVEQDLSTNKQNLARK